MPTSMRYALALKFLGGIAFLVAIVTAGAMNRSLAIIPLFALAMTLAGLILRRGVTQGLDLGALMGMPTTPNENRGFFDGAFNMFVQRLVGVAVLFGLTVLIAALFRETDIDRLVGVSDAALVGVPFAITLAAGYASQRMLSGMGDELAAMMAQMQSKMADMQAQRAGPGGAEVQPGQAANDDEIIDADYTDVTPPEDSSAEEKPAENMPAEEKKPDKD